MEDLSQARLARNMCGFPDLQELQLKESSTVPPCNTEGSDITTQMRFRREKLTHVYMLRPQFQHTETRRDKTKSPEAGEKEAKILFHLREHPKILLRGL